MGHKSYLLKLLLPVIYFQITLGGHVPAYSNSMNSQLNGSFPKQSADDGLYEFINLYNQASLKYLKEGPVAFVSSMSQGLALNQADSQALQKLFLGLPKLPKIEPTQGGVRLFDDRQTYSAEISIQDLDKKIVNINGHSFAFNPYEPLDVGSARLRDFIKSRVSKSMVPNKTDLMSLLIPEAHAFLIPLIAGGVAFLLLRGLFQKKDQSYAQEPIQQNNSFIGHGGYGSAQPSLTLYNGANPSINPNPSSLPNPNSNPNTDPKPNDDLNLEAIKTRVDVLEHSLKTAENNVHFERDMEAVERVMCGLTKNYRPPATISEAMGSSINFQANELSLFARMNQQKWSHTTWDVGDLSSETMVAADIASALNKDSFTLKVYPHSLKEGVSKKVHYIVERKSGQREIKILKIDETDQYKKIESVVSCKSS